MRFGPNSGGGDLEFETRLYTVDGAVGLTDSPFETTYWQYDDAWTPSDVETSEYVYLPFEDPIDLTTENFYFLGVINEFESEAQLTVMGNADSDTDGSTGDYGLTGAGDFAWFTSQTATPAIRLVLSPEPFTYPGCTDLTACNYDPDAEEDDGSCEYESCAGCLDELACNFNPQATIANNESCAYPGCDDPSASNYDALRLAVRGSACTWPMIAHPSEMTPGRTKRWAFSRTGKRRCTACLGKASGYSMFQRP